MYKNSIRIYTIVEIIKSFWLGVFISIIFFKFIGMNDFQISLFHIIGAILLFTFEIPTGFIADKYGYKNSIILGYIFLFFGFSSYVFSSFTHYWIVLSFSSLFFALYHSFLSGAQSSYLYSAFKLDKVENKYLDYTSKLNIYSKLSKAVAVFLGTYLYSIGEILPYSIQAILVLLSIGLMFLIKPIPKRYNKYPFSIGNHMRNTIQIFNSKRFLIFLFLFMFFSTSVFQFFNHLINQNFWIEQGLSISMIGYLGIFVFIMDGFIGLSAPFLWKFFGSKRIFIFLGVLSLIIPIILGISKNYYVIIFFSGLIYSLYTINVKVVEFSVQKVGEDGLRAGVISMGNMFVSLSSKIFLVGVGIMVGYITYSESLIILGGIFGTTTIIITIAHLNYRTKKT